MSDEDYKYFNAVIGNDLCTWLEQNLSPHLNCVAALPC